MKTEGLRTSSGKPITLGHRIGEGGEGMVARLAENGNLCAKVYRTQDDADHNLQKILALTSLQSEELRAIAAWPIEEVLDSSGSLAGFTMDCLDGWMPLFMGYQIKSRAQKIGGAKYAFLVRMARNLAAAVHKVHQAGLVIGDLNESNTLWDRQAMVKLIDVDSFQIRASGKTYTCGVAKPELLAPELQGKSLADYERTPNHDRFPLAVLIFQLLVFGRHPFAGRPKGNEEVRLEQAINKGWYVYTEQREVPLAAPPGLESKFLPDEIKALFERAFEPGRERPSGEEWYGALKRLEESLAPCNADDSHEFWDGCPECPWCRLEKVWRISLFGQMVRTDTPATSNSFDPDMIVGELSSVNLPAVQELPKVPTLAQTEPAPLPFTQKIAGLLVRTQILTSAAATAALLSPGIPPQLKVGAAGVWAAGLAFVHLTGLPKRKRELTKEVEKTLRQRAWMAMQWRLYASPEQIRQLAEEIRNLRDRFHITPERMEELRRDQLRQAYGSHLQVFLKKYSIIAADIPKASAEMKRRLAAGGIETAADITPENISESNSKTAFLTAGSRRDLMEWRERLESSYWRSTSFSLSPARQQAINERIAREQQQIQDEMITKIGLLKDAAGKIGKRQEYLLGQIDGLDWHLGTMAGDIRAIEKSTGAVLSP